MGLEQAMKVARDLGCEAEANGIPSLLGYQKELDIDPREDIAKAYGVTSWDDIPAGDRSQVLKAFREGKQREKDLQGMI